MHLTKEKGRPAEGSPIPNAVVYHDSADTKAHLLSLQVSRLSKLYAVNASMAEALAPFVFMGALR